MKDLAGKKVFVGLSGGVDSAVSAALLLQRGAEVTGVFIKGWYPPGMPCTWSEDRQDAMRAAAHLGIPFHTLDASREYKEGVINYLLSEYALGRTPNPDIMCNKEVKFGVFWDFACKNDADYLATGHYAINKEGEIYRGVDESKDQSYFLWAASKEALSHTLFPLGELQKDDTRRLAQELRLPQATKRDSQGVCFLGNISMEDFLRNELDPTPGEALDEHGAVLGTHEGSVLATLGERVSLTDAPQGPWYVLKKDMVNNTLTVAHEPRVKSSEKVIRISNTHLLSTEALEGEVEAQYRYHGPRIKGLLSPDATSFTPSTELEEALAPGQSLVLYRDGKLVGGGIIE
jgi:tRNA-uridine 2-sulfurtransferase